MSRGRERDIARRNTHILNSRYAQKRVNHSNSMYALLEAIKSTQIRQSPSTKIWNWIVFFFDGGPWNSCQTIVRCQRQQHTTHTRTVIFLLFFFHRRHLLTQYFAKRMNRKLDISISLLFAFAFLFAGLPKPQVKREIESFQSDDRTMYDKYFIEFIHK